MKTQLSTAGRTLRSKPGGSMLPVLMAESLSWALSLGSQLPGRGEGGTPGEGRETSLGMAGPCNGHS